MSKHKSNEDRLHRIWLSLYSRIDGETHHKKIQVLIYTLNRFSNFVLTFKSNTVMRKICTLLVWLFVTLPIFGQTITPVGSNVIYPVAQSSMKGNMEFFAANLYNSLETLYGSLRHAGKIHHFKNGELQGTYKSELGAYVEFNYSYSANTSSQVKSWSQSKQIAFSPAFTTNQNDSYFAFVDKDGALFMVDVKTDEIIKQFEGDALGEFFSITVLSDGSKGQGKPELQVIVSNRGYVRVYDNIIEEDNSRVYVDLGLPSGTLWATTNLGATKCENFGYYYSWGETETKGSYQVDNYKWSNADMTEFSKYNNDPSKGIVDNLFELEAEDDAALATWGEGWSIPNRSDFEELMNYCSYSWTDFNGVPGLNFVGQNGNSMFLPAAGFRVYDIDSHSNEWGYYATRDLYTMESEDCILFMFEPGETHAYWTNLRYYGYPVRPIYKAPTGVNSVSIDQQKSFWKVFDIQGRKLQHLEKGVNIIVGKDGKGSKIIK